MDETQIKAQEGYYPIREAENDKIKAILQPGIDSDLKVFEVFKENYPKLLEEWHKRNFNKTCISG